MNKVHPCMNFNRPGPCLQCQGPGWEVVTDPDYSALKGEGVNEFGLCLSCQEHLNAEVAQAERAAGWDPNP